MALRCLRNSGRFNLEYADSLAEARRDEPVEFTFIGGGPGTMTRAEILLHVVNHGTYHRGHVAGMMHRVGRQAPVSDLPVFLREQRNVLQQVRTAQETAQPPDH